MCGAEISGLATTATAGPKNERWLDIYICDGFANRHHLDGGNGSPPAKVRSSKHQKLGATRADVRQSLMVVAGGRNGDAVDAGHGFE